MEFVLCAQDEMWEVVEAHVEWGLMINPYLQRGRYGTSVVGPRRAAYMCAILDFYRTEGPPRRTLLKIVGDLNTVEQVCSIRFLII